MVGFRNWWDDVEVGWRWTLVLCWLDEVEVGTDGSRGRDRGRCVGGGCCGCWRLVVGTTGMGYGSVRFRLEPPSEGWNHLVWSRW
ncbi:hypothetical protein [Candidatus Hodgkinia cicadicola]|uniref:hypothetical protein n=1 Tax=Candidatus Hodgkinia cicadicola TaxID=573658 RepID=UPI001788C0CD